MINKRQSYAGDYYYVIPGLSLHCVLPVEEMSGT